ncbi:hypothetical protein SOVF_015880 [Spinacia oleracea]|nr:hypothetical protein SOVF_015880 [Spinacia oleracea]
MSTSSSSIRTLGAALQRISNGTSSSPFKSLSLSSSSLLWNGRISKRLASSSSSFSSSSLWGSELPHRLSHQYDYQCASVRKIWTCSPLCMGRRSSKIATRKVFNFAKLQVFNFFNFPLSIFMLVSENLWC